MKPLFDIKDVDREFYEQRLRDFLPAEIIDIHVHVWLAGLQSRDSDEPRRTVTWPSRVAAENPVGDLVETYRLMLPGKKVKALIFGTIPDRDKMDEANSYVSKSAAEQRFPSLIFARPEWSGAELEDKIMSGGFLGVKVYLSLSPSYIPTSEIRIFDFLPHHQLEVLNRRGWIAMLHIPRPGRLRDPVNLQQMLEIEARYPNVKLIIAHVGRAYCPEDVGDAFETLGGTKKMLFDISANTSEEVFRRLIEAVGPKRILFGSDMPISRMRMRRICEAGNYVNLVPRGLYGDVSGDKNMREVDGDEAARLSFFLYEEIDAFRRAAEATRLSRSDVADVFHNNAEALIRATSNP